MYVSTEKVFGRFMDSLKTFPKRSVTVISRVELEFDAFTFHIWLVVVVLKVGFVELFIAGAEYVTR